MTSVISDLNLKQNHRMYEYSEKPDVELPRVLQALHVIYTPTPTLPPTHSNPTNNSSNTNNSNFNLSNNNNNTLSREEANAYLVGFQKRSVAWGVCVNILSSASNPNHSNPNPNSHNEAAVHFFAAQTLHSKCQRDIHLLSPNDIASLREALLRQFQRVVCQSFSTNSNVRSSTNISTNISAHGNGNGNSSRALVTMLAMALSALAVQIHWTTYCHDVLNFNIGSHIALDDLTALTGNAVTAAHVQQQMVLELVTLLPEECCSHRLLLPDESQLGVFKKSLVEASHDVLAFLHQCLIHAKVHPALHASGSANTDSTHHISIKVLKCFLSWIIYIAIPPHLLQHTPLLPWLFDIVSAGDGNQYTTSVFHAATITQQQHPSNHPSNHPSIVQGDMFDLATDVIIQLLQCYPSHHDSHMGLVHTLIPLVMALGGSSTTVTNPTTGTSSTPTATTPFAKALHEEDSDALRAYCRIFAEMGESYTSLLFSPQDMNQSTLVEQILSCSSIPELEVATITLNFWYKFVTWMEDLQPYAYRQYQVDNFTPQLMKLVIACTSLLRYPQDWIDMAQDQQEDVYKNRFDVLETLEDCCRLLGGPVVLHQIGQSLQVECTRVTSLPPDQQMQQWQGIESCLMALSATSRYISRDEDQILPFVMRLLPELPPTVHLLRASANKLIGAYAMWLDGHPNHLQPLLPYLAQSLSNHDCASSAAVAIKELCENCSTEFALGDSVLQLYDGIVAAQPLQPNASVISLKDELEVLEGACKAVSRQLQEMASAGTSPDGFSTYIGRCVQPIGERLTAFATPTSTVAPQLILADIERLTVVVRFLKIPNTSNNVAARSQFLIDLMSQCWPLLDTLSRKFIRNINLAEKLCRLHKHVLRECGAEAY